jgi:ribonuclease T2
MLRAAAVATLLAALPGTAIAQQRGGPAGTFDFYVLALSWTAGFCEVEGDDKNREQCQVGKKLGFTVHGLWPQNERGFPTDCGPSGRTPSRAAVDEAMKVFTSEGLARHQWRKHGTCSGSSPTDYFRDTKAAVGKVKIPDGFADATREQRWNPIDLERAFIAANTGLRADMMSVACRRGVLSEVRICLSKDLRSFRACEEVDRGGCRTREITVPPVR